MASSSLKEIESAIQQLTRQEIEELYAWLDEHYREAIDVRIKADMAAGRLDASIDRALEDERNGRTRSL